MSRAYWRVSPAFWSDEKVTGAGGGEPWSDDAKLLALYLLTCKHRTLEGLFLLPKGYIMEDVEWSAERLAKPFAQLLQDGFIEYDEKARLCLIVNALDYQTPDNPNQIKAAVRFLADLPQSSLFARLLEQAQRFCQPLAERLQQELPERFSKPFGKPLTLTPTPALLSEGVPASGDTTEAEQEADTGAFRDIDFGEDAPEPEPPADKHTDAQQLVAYYAGGCDLPNRSKPTKTQIGILAAIVGEKLSKKAKPENVHEGIRLMFVDGKGPTTLPAYISQVEASVAEAARNAPRNTFPPPEPPMTPEEKAASLEALKASRQAYEASRRGGPTKEPESLGAVMARGGL